MIHGDAPAVLIPNPGGRFRMCKGSCFGRQDHFCMHLVTNIIVANSRGTQSSCQLVGCGILELPAISCCLAAFARFIDPSTVDQIGFEVHGSPEWGKTQPWPRFGTTRALHVTLHQLNRRPRGVQLLLPALPTAAPALPMTSPPRVPAVPVPVGHVDVPVPVPAPRPTPPPCASSATAETEELAGVDDAVLVELYGSVDAMRTSNSLSPQTDLASAATDVAYLNDAVSDLSTMLTDDDNDGDDAVGWTLDVHVTRLAALVATWRDALHSNRHVDPAAVALDTTTVSAELQSLATDVGLAALLDGPSQAAGPDVEVRAVDGERADGTKSKRPTLQFVVGLSFSSPSGAPLRRFDRAVHDEVSYCRGDLFARGTTFVARSAKEDKAAVSEREAAWSQLRRSSPEVRALQSGAAEQLAAVKATTGRSGSISVPGIATKMRLAQRGIGTIGDSRPAVVAALRRRRTADGRT